MTHEWKKCALLLPVLLALTVLANVPFLSSRLVFGHDTLHVYACFQFIYSHVFCFNELPDWAPLICYGIPTDFYIFYMQPTHWIMMGVGWLFGITDALLLFKLAVIVIECIFVWGLFLLCRHCFQFSLAALVVCLGAILTTSWLMQVGHTLGISYMLPFVFYNFLKYVDGKNPTHLWIAAIFELYSWLGMAPYVVPIHMLMLLTFLLPFVSADHKLLAALFHWRTYVHPLFFFFMGFLILAGVFVFGMTQGITIVDSQRDPVTGRLSLDIFLTQARQGLSGLAIAFVKGDVPHSSIVLFVGVLPVGAMFYGLACRRDVRFLAFALAALVLFWFSQMGWFATALYYVFPLMNTHRHPSHVLNIARIFVLLLGGFGIDRLLRDLANPSARQTRFTGRSARIVGALLLVCFVDVFANFRSEDLWGAEGFRVDENYSDYTFHANPYADYWLIGRFLLYAALFGAILSLVWQAKSRPGTDNAGGDTALARPQALSSLVGGLMLLVYLLDAGFFYFLVVDHAPYCPAPVEVGQVFHVQCLKFEPQRRARRELFGKFLDLSAHASETMAVLECARERSTIVRYAEWQLLMMADGPKPLFPVQLVSTGVKEMILARGGIIERSAGFILPDDDPAFYRSLGVIAKLRVLRKVVFAENQQQAMVLFSKLPNPDEVLVLSGSAGPPLDKGHGTTADSEPKVTSYSANRVAIDVKASAPGWLLFADAYHPSWKATVNDHETKVYRANVGFKAVAIAAGDNKVVFRFENTYRVWLRTALYLTAVALGLVLLGTMAVHAGQPFQRRRQAEKPDLLVNTPATVELESGAAGDPGRVLKRIAIWSGALLIANLGCALLQWW